MAEWVTHLMDENGERIPVIGKKAGQQKVDKQSRRNLLPAIFFSL